MSRKRTVASILNDDASSSSTNQPSEEIKIVMRKRTKVRCFCSKCNRKLVDPRTKKAHEQKDSTSLETSDEQLTSLPIDTNFSNETTEVPQVLIEEFDSLLVQSLDPMTADDIYSTPIFDYNEPNFNFRPRKKGVKKVHFDMLSQLMMIMLKTMKAYYPITLWKMMILTNLRYKVTKAVVIMMNF